MARCSRPTLRVLSHNPQSSRPSSVSDVTMTKPSLTTSCEGKRHSCRPMTTLPASSKVLACRACLAGILNPFDSLASARLSVRTFKVAILKDFISAGFSITNLPSVFTTSLHMSAGDPQISRPALPAHAVSPPLEEQRAPHTLRDHPQMLELPTPTRLPGNSASHFAIPWLQDTKKIPLSHTDCAYRAHSSIALNSTLTRYSYLLLLQLLLLHTVAPAINSSSLSSICWYLGGLCLDGICTAGVADAAACCSPVTGTAMFRNSLIIADKPAWTSICSFGKQTLPCRGPPSLHRVCSYCAGPAHHRKADPTANQTKNQQLLANLQSPTGRRPRARPRPCGSSRSLKRFDSALDTARAVQKAATVAPRW